MGKKEKEDSIKKKERRDKKPPASGSFDFPTQLILRLYRQWVLQRKQGVHLLVYNIYFPFATKRNTTFNNIFADFFSLLLIGG